MNPHAVTTADHAHASPHEMSFVRKYIFSLDHKVIGIQYGLTSLCFMLFGFFLMILMRWQIAHSGKALPVIGPLLANLFGDVAAKGIMFFQEIDQAQLSSKAGIELRPSVLLIFGNPPLGTQFLTANPQAGLDWPVRMLVVEEADGSVWLAWTDFAWMAKRYGITTQDAQFKMAAEVAGGIAADAAK